MLRATTSPSREGSAVSAPFSAAEYTQILEQLERMLASPLFSHSKRYAPFLRYTVEKALDGRESELKERTIGIEVLGRVPDYDTNADPAVRVIAGEVRRRLAQYYQESAHSGELRINLTPGSYIPGFELHPANPESLASLPLIAAVPLEARLLPVEPTEAFEALAPAALTVTGRGLRPVWLWASLLVAVVAACAVYGLVRHYNQPTALHRWWQPALERPSGVILSVGMIDNIPNGTPGEGAPRDASGTVGDYVRHKDHVGLVDVIALQRFASMMSGFKQAYRTQSAGSTSYGDLRNGPVVLVAGLNNPWTLRITDPLRYHFSTGVNQQRNAILDRQNPKADWVVDFASPSSSPSRDYAIIARLHDIATDQPIFIAAGLGSNGTSAAAEYMTSESQIKQLIDRLPRDWQKMNIEAVIQTDVIGNQPGPPVVVALYLW